MPDRKSTLTFKVAGPSAIVLAVLCAFFGVSKWVRDTNCPRGVTQVVRDNPPPYLLGTYYYRATPRGKCSAFDSVADYGGKITFTMEGKLLKGIATVEWIVDKAGHVHHLRASTDGWGTSEAAIIGASKMVYIFTIGDGRASPVSGYSRLDILPGPSGIQLKGEYRRTGPDHEIYGNVIMQREQFDRGEIEEQLKAHSHSGLRSSSQCASAL
jgi:hypothetical protein